MDSNGSVGRGSAKRAPSKRSSMSRKPATKAGGSAVRSVRSLRLSKALTLPDSTTVADACRRMASRRVDACLLTDSSALLCGIMTDRDLALKCVGDDLDVNTTLCSQIMTKNPIFVSVESSAVDALQKMVQGRFRHLPVIENGEVVALLNITKCLYDAISRMERAAEKGHAIATALGDVERQFGQSASGFLETFRDKMFRPTLGSIMGEPKLATVNKSDSILTAAKRMRLVRSSAAIVTNPSTNKPVGIVTTKDILMRVLALSLKPEETLVEKIMTPNPECVNTETTIVDALHAMHDGKFLHLPVVDSTGSCIACVDVVHLTQGAMSSAAGSGADTEAQSQLMQRFWDSALALETATDNDDDTVSVRSADVGDPLVLPGKTRSVLGDDAPDAPFPVKMEDRKGRVHRFAVSADSMTELVCAVATRLGDDYDQDNPPSIMYEDEEGDKVVISVDEDWSAAVKFARASGKKGIKLTLDYHDEDGDGHIVQQRYGKPTAQGLKPPKAQKTMSMKGPRPPFQTQKSRRNAERDDELARMERSMRMYTWSMIGVATVAVVGVGVAAYLQRSRS